MTKLWINWISHSFIVKSLDYFYLFLALSHSRESSSTSLAHFFLINLFAYLIFCITIGNIALLLILRLLLLQEGYLTLGWWNRYSKVEIVRRMCWYMHFVLTVSPQSHTQDTSLRSLKYTHLSKILMKFFTHNCFYIHFVRWIESLTDEKFSFNEIHSLSLCMRWIL